VFGGSGCTAWWWLRSPGINQNNAANVNNDGNVNLNGNNGNNDSGGIRPALLPTPEACRKRGGLCEGVKGTDFPLAPLGQENKSRRRRGRSAAKSCFHALEKDAAGSAFSPSGGLIGDNDAWL